MTIAQIAVASVIFRTVAGGVTYAVTGSVGAAVLIGGSPLASRRSAALAVREWLDVRFALLHGERVSFVRTERSCTRCLDDPSVRSRFV